MVEKLSWHLKLKFIITEPHQDDLLLKYIFDVLFLVYIITLWGGGPSKCPPSNMLHTKMYTYHKISWQ